MLFTAPAMAAAQTSPTAPIATVGNSWLAHTQKDSKGQDLAKYRKAETKSPSSLKEKQEDIYYASCALSREKDNGFDEDKVTKFLEIADRSPLEFSVNPYAQARANALEIADIKAKTEKERYQQICENDTVKNAYVAQRKTLEAANAKALKKEYTTEKAILDFFEEKASEQAELLCKAANANRPQDRDEETTKYVKKVCEDAEMEYTGE
jgi:hypothetical protein